MQLQQATLQAQTKSRCVTYLSLRHHSCFTQKRIVEELLHEDGLTILANGLTWQKICAVLLRVQIERRRDPAQRGVLLVLGCRDWQRSTLKGELGRLDPQLIARCFAFILHLSIDNDAAAPVQADDLREY